MSNFSRRRPPERAQKIAPRTCGFLLVTENKRVSTGSRRPVQAVGGSRRGDDLPGLAPRSGTGVRTSVPSNLSHVNDVPLPFRGGEEGEPAAGAGNGES